MGRSGGGLELDSRAIRRGSSGAVYGTAYRLLLRFDFYFRLSFAPLPGVERIMVSTEYMKNIWVPDTFFANEKSSYLQMATTSNELLLISHLGEINSSIR